jgi:CHAT domain-containing protein
MDLFYSNLLAGLKPAAALHASINTLRADPSTAHPYYWAAFSLFGVAD